MSTYNTGNPLGSARPEDLFDNSQNIDKAANDLAAATWPDRFGRERTTLSEYERRAEGKIEGLEQRITESTNRVWYDVFAAPAPAGKKSMQADTSRPDGTRGFVDNDPDPLKRGQYKSVGGVWAKTESQPTNSDAIAAAVDPANKFAVSVSSNLSALSLVDPSDPKISVIDFDAADRASCWIDYNEGTEGLYIKGRRVGSDVPQRGGTLAIVKADGQSNEGGQSGASRSIVYSEYYDEPDRVLMLGSAANNIWLGAVGTSSASRLITPGEITGLTRLRSSIASSDAHATTAVEGFLFAQLSKPDPFSRYDGFVTWNTAEGNQSVANMLNDAPADQHYFQNQLTCVTRAVELARARGQRCAYPFIRFGQGESDSNLNNLGEMQNLYRIQTDASVRPITGQPGPVRMLTWQMSSFRETTRNGVRSILNSAIDRAGTWAVFLCAGATYIFPFSPDYLHQTSVGHARRGEYENAIIDSFWATGTYLPLHMLQAQVTGANQITVTLSEAAVNDEAWLVGAISNMGITLDGGTIASVAVSGTNLIIGTAGAASAVTAVHAALTGQPAGTRTAEGIPRSTIRSIASLGTWSSITGGGQMYKPLCHQTIAITA